MKTRRSKNNISSCLICNFVISISITLSCLTLISYSPCRSYRHKAHHIDPRLSTHAVADPTLHAHSATVVMTQPMPLFCFSVFFLSVDLLFLFPFLFYFIFFCLGGKKMEEMMNILNEVDILAMLSNFKN